MAYISDKLRQQVIERANERCEYCQTQQIIVISMEIDHIVPVSANGETTLHNLCLACIGCNGFKLDYQTGIDPETSQEIPLFNPRKEQWNDHFEWDTSGVHLTGVSPTGRATITRLRMNRESVLASRRVWARAGWHPPK